VAARTSSFSFKGTDVTIADIGGELNVATVLEGSVRKTGDRVRITTQLIGVADGFQLWSETYDRELEDIFEVQNDIAGSVARALQVTLLGAESASRHIHPDAYNAYLQGKFFADRFSEEDLRAAVGHFEQALEIQPDWAEAWVGLAMAESRRADWGYVQLDEGYGRALAAAERAVRLDPDLATAHAVAGWIKQNYDWDWAGADAAFRRALKLEPGNAAALDGAAHLARTLGLYDKAVALSRRVVELDPLSPFAHLFLGEHALLAGRFDEATAALEKTLKLNPSQTAAHWVLCWTLLEQSRPEDALVEIEREVDPFFRLHGRVLAHQMLGQEEEAESALQQLIEEYADTGAFQVAIGYAYREDSDEAFAWLERAYDQRDTGLPFIKSALASRLQNDPRWKPFMEKMGLPE
jgi:tetratricopeptide (TPR) repeat protein